MTSTNPRPIASAIVATRNRSQRISATLRALLSTTPPPDEILVVDQSDPAPAEGTRRAAGEVAEWFGAPLTIEDESRPPMSPGTLRYVLCHGRGASNGRNTGARLARGEIL